MMQACCERIAEPQSPRPSGCASLADIVAWRALEAVGPAAATTSRYSLSGFISAMEVKVNLPPFAAASHTRSNSSARDDARMIASLVALSAASMRVRRSFWTSVRALSSARSKFSSANDTLSANRCSSSENSEVKVSLSSDI